MNYISIKKISSFQNGYAFQSDDLKVEGINKVVKIKNIKQSIDLDDIQYTNLDDDKLKTFKIKKNDILIAMSGATIGKIAIAGEVENAYINQRVGIIRSEYSKFIYYNLLNPMFKEYVYLKSLSTAQPNISASDILNFNISEETVNNHKKIVDLLDEKCNEIDLIITNTKYTIDEYKKIKQSLIKESVTIGLNKNIKMKESNVEWIGKTPEHWKMCNPYRYSRIIRGNSAFTKDDLKAEGDFVGLQYGKTYKTNEIDNDFNFYVESKFYKEDQVIIKGSTIFITTSETMEDLGHSTFYNRDDIGLLGGEQISILPNSETFDNKYFYYASTCFKYEMNKFATGLKVFRTKANDLKKINMMIPPLVEQKEIVSYLDEKCNEIDNLIDKKHEILKELETYKQSLIFEYVTGKKDV